MEVTMCWRTVGLFVVTAFAEIIGCYLSWLWLKKGASFLLMLPAAVSFSLFVWLLSLHPAAAGRVYASYGGVYVSVALFWLWAVDGIRPPISGILLVGCHAYRHGHYCACSQRLSFTEL